MATSASTLIERTRRYVRDFPELDTLTASATPSASSLTVADGTRYFQHMLIEVGQEVMRVTADGSGTSVSVQRGVRGSVAAAHTNGATVLFQPAFYAVEILDALNEGIGACFPLIYKPVVDESLTTTADTYEYNVPNMSGIDVPIPYISRISIKESGFDRFLEKRDWWIIRGGTPKVRFKRPEPASATIRIEGFGSFQHLAAVTNLEELAGADVSFESGTTGYTTGGTNTLESSDAQAKFGSRSAKATYEDNANLLQRNQVVGAAGAHSFSRWVYIPTGFDGDGLRVVLTGFTGATGTISVAADMSTRDEWQRVEVPNVTIDAGDLSGTISVQTTGTAPTAGKFVYVDGCQTEAQGVTTPFTTNTLDTLFPSQADYLPCLYAASTLLTSGEAGRVRHDVGMPDERENANRVGSSMRAAERLERRFYSRLDLAAMGPMPKHVVSVI